MTKTTKRVSVFILFGFIATFAGCFQSDAARMEEFRKYGGAGAKDDDDDEVSIAQAPATNYVPPPRSNEAADSNSKVATSDSVASAGSPTKFTAVANAPAVIQGLSDTKSPPAAPLSKEERRKMTIENLNKISAALEAFRGTKNGASYPPQYSVDGAGAGKLSWRVQLLPYLGYADLYNQFRHNELWNSTHNRTLIEKIPSVYQSPDRFDAYTNYVVPSGGSAAFDGGRAKPIRRWEDGLENSIILAEVDDDHSVIWTEPRDLRFDPREPKKGLGGLRDDGFFAIWGGGEVTIVPNGGGNVRNAFTVDGGDVTVASLKKPAFAGEGGLSGMFQRNSPAQSTASNAQNAETKLETAVARSDASSETDVTLNLPDAQTAFTEGREADAMKIFYVNALAGSNAAFDHYQWVPGLGRPTPVIRYGIGIEYHGGNVNAVKRAALLAMNQSGSPGRQRNSVANVYEKLTGGFGQKILSILVKRPMHGPFVIEEVATETRRRRDEDDETQNVGSKLNVSRLAPGVQFVGVDSPAKLLSAADKHMIDALVLFEITDRRVNKEIRVAIVDVAKRKRIYSTKKLSSRDVAAAKMDLVADDPTPAVIAELNDYVVTKLAATQMPSGLKPSSAAKRVAKLGTQKSNPLRNLAEIQLYRHMGLIDVQKQSDAYGNVLSGAHALTLIGGNLAERLELLQPFLPRNLEFPDS